jgi:hypothetical protein
MAKTTTKYFSASVPHSEIPGAFLGSFGLPGKPTEWVVDRGQRKVFGTAEDAELAGYRIIMMHLNGARDTQSFVSKRRSTDDRPRRRTLSLRPGEPSIDEVFKKWTTPQDS